VSQRIDRRGPHHPFARFGTSTVSSITRRIGQLGDGMGWSRRAVPYHQTEARTVAAIAAGGRLVTDQHARSFWVLAGAEGNEACVSATMSRRLGRRSSEATTG
jgi:hypothetical protein